MLALLCAHPLCIGPLALRAAKQAISRAPELDLESGKYSSHRLHDWKSHPMSPGLDFERESYEPLLKSKDRLEALQAFKEKRRPIFMGE